MTNMKQLEQKLQKAERKQAVLYIFCNFVSLLLITSYSAMMFSPTVLLVLPEGGDSRKQMIMIFVLALVGCVVFTIYASNLFFRKKSRQLGTLMALGASKRHLAPGLFREVLLISGFSSLFGIIAGFPFVYLLWNSFRYFIVDSSQMMLKLDFKCLYISAIFFVIVVTLSCLNAYRYLKRTNIIDIVREEHKNEPVKELGRWCGPVGFLLILIGAICGYESTYVYMTLFSAYPSSLINICYAPVFIGLYMVMLHTVVHGWRSHKKHPYHNIIARSMVKFQGKQTVNNLLVSTLLIAGSSFAIFYIPMISVGHIIELRSRPFDYSYHYRMDQKVMNQNDISKLAAKYNISIKDFRESPYIMLAMDANVMIEDDERHFHYEHEDLAMETSFFSETGFYNLTGNHISVEKGQYYVISTKEETEIYYYNPEATFLTNMVTRKTIPVSFAGYAHYNFLSNPKGFCILNDEDYKIISEGLTLDWQGKMAFFNTDDKDNYDFAQDFFYTLVSSFGSECELPYVYDRVIKIATEEAGEVYWGDTDKMSRISYDEPDNSDFRIYWTYMPQIRLIDQNDYYRTYAVFLMMFLFISIICILASLIISYTRCITISMNNKYVFDDLKRLGASPAFLKKEIKNQANTVFKVPVIIGMSSMYLLYVLLMFGNDGKIATTEAYGLIVCLGILFLIASIFYIVYRYTIKKMCTQLEIIH